MFGNWYYPKNRITPHYNGRKAQSLRHDAFSERLGFGGTPMTAGQKEA
jgi:hypothetical protein